MFAKAKKLVAVFAAASFVLPVLKAQASREIFALPATQAMSDRLSLSVTDCIFKTIGIDPSTVTFTGALAFEASMNNGDPVTGTLQNNVIVERDNRLIWPGVRVSGLSITALSPIIVIDQGTSALPFAMNIRYAHVELNRLTSDYSVRASDNDTARMTVALAREVQMCFDGRPLRPPDVQRGLRPPGVTLPPVSGTPAPR